ncbi:hypothetical protein Tsubulata_029161 [Turnera subulata]|uniref:F-box protein n=1 Tax=Turnera subulata TaxID=218843 RepID=A0A9Q0FW96_9ROSI|nr:hypothetical protein Tsubulata_029161 [Turnera subulata]
MATIKASSMLLPSLPSSSSSSSRRGIAKATLNLPKLGIPKHSKRDLVEQLKKRSSSVDYERIETRNTITPMEDEDYHAVSSRNHSAASSPSTTRLMSPSGSDPLVIAKLYEIMGAMADRVEMHKNIGEQRDNWNHLLLTSINGITLAAATMCGVAAASGGSGAAAANLLGLKLSSSMLYLAATGMLAVMNKIQPSQLAEEQRNAARLFKQLQNQIQTLLTIGNPTSSDVEEAIENVLALDKAYPLPLLGVMLEKYPSAVEPAVWWPQQRRKQAKGLGKKINENGWTKEMEDEMREIVGILQRNDKADYLRLGQKALKVHKSLAMAGPLLTGLACIGSAFVGNNNPWAAMVGVGCGALASVVNAMEHGGQVGMVFDMYRSNAGFFKLMEETIESNLNERNVWGRENGEILELKMALQLGRSPSELRNLATSSANRKAATEEFASKLF